jgi:hypothetical protein
VLPATTATRTSEDSPVGTNYWRWPSRNSPIARACAISSPACALPSKLYPMGFRGQCRARHRPMPTNHTIGESLRSSLKYRSVLPGCCMRMTRLASILIQVCMLWIRRPSICACGYSRGRSFGGARPPSKCILCWTCTATFPRSSASPAAMCTTGDVHDVNILDEIAIATKTAGPGGQSLSNATDSERHALRENPHFIRLSDLQGRCRIRRKR